jgi:RHH-type proline utilization regulon transcriptional repressor/proline dehydrogenase/delta 1-pyrroline-5-carboxylate dehydrogenase
VRLNINLLGEAILSDAEAERRTAALLARIARDDVDYLSVKLSAIVANLDAYAFEESVERIAARIRTLYRAATSSSPPTFVNLDMEEYGDLELTVAAFTQVLDEPEFGALDAGIVLQAPTRTTHWNGSATGRRRGTGAPEAGSRCGS